MVKTHKKAVVGEPQPHKKARVEWTPKMTMNMSDLSRDDDFLNHLLVEKLGTGGVPLYVHKMDPTRRLPKTDPKDLMAIVQRVSPLSPHLCCGRILYAGRELLADASLLLSRRVVANFCSSSLPRDTP